MKKCNLISIAIITTICGVVMNLPHRAAASEEPLTVNQSVEKAFFEHSDDIYGISTMGGFLNDVFGWKALIEGSYPENQIRRDGRLINTLHQDLWKQQTQSTPAIRTNDLHNPYCGSIQTGMDKTCPEQER